MKKRLLSVLLLVCMVLTLLPTAALAGDMHEHDALPAAAHTHCYCGGSVNAGDHTRHSDVTYTACTKANYLRQIFWIEKTDVAYAYLENDITLDGNLNILGDKNLGAKTLYLCLNGHTLNLGEYYIWVGNRGGKLYLCDCSANKTGTVSGGSNCCVSVDDAADYKATFNMYGGTLKNGNRTGHGGGVGVLNGTMNMYGGTITENKATSDGGGIYVGTKGTLNLYGGTITNNTVTTNESRHGGGVYVESNYLTGAGTISISGSPVITGNTRVYTNASTGAQTTSTENLYLSYGFYNSGQFPTITLGTLTSGADIGIWAGESVFSTASDTDYSGYFSSDVAGYHVEYNANKKLELKPGAALTLTVKFDANTDDPTVTGMPADMLVTAKDGAFVFNLPTAAPKRTGYHLKWWSELSDASGGNYDPGDQVIIAASASSEKTFYAIWEAHSDTNKDHTCDVCKETISAHDFTAETADEKYLKSATDCENAAVYYKSCAICGLSSKGMEGEATFTSGNILGHDWGEPSYTWTPVPDGYTCVAYSKCSRCTEDVSDVASVTYAVTKESTCLNTGTGTYTATFSPAYGFPAQTKTVTLPATGHSWGEPEYIWTETEDGYDCTAKRVCKNDGTHVEDETVIAAYSVITKPTCLTTGLGRYYAAFAADWATAGATKEVTLAALGHAYGDWTSNGDGTHTRICSRDASHTETGDCTGGTATCTAKAVCETCGGAYGALASHNFTAETVDGKYLKSAATCTEKAVYYKSCSTCGLTSKGTADEATFESGVALDHNWGAWTSNGNGTHTRTCKRDTSHTETGDCTGGTATCTAKAVCETCGGAYGAKDPDNHTGKLAWDITETHHEQAWTCCGLITVAKAAHTFGDWVVTKRPTSREEGEKARTCSVCGYTETKVLPKTGGGPTYYTLVFESNGGSKITNVNERHGTVVDLTLAKYQPTRTGYDFTGWYSDKTLTRRVTSIKLYENMTVYAGWSTRELPFTDVGRGDWFFDDVRYVYETGLMNGVSATRFAPYGSTTRGMIVTILYRMEGQPAVSRDCPFTDVASGSYYERAITWAAANGIVTGHSGTIFAPDASITREQLAAILYRYAVYKGLDVSVGENTNILSYEDFASLSEYAIPAMQWACGAGVLYGFGGSLLPDAPANRLQAAAILHRFCVNILN